jgi:hypothetical protein
LLKGIIFVKQIKTFSNVFDKGFTALLRVNILTKVMNTRKLSFY